MTNEDEPLLQRIQELTGWANVKPPEVVNDTADCMAIKRGDILVLDGKRFLISGHKYETRFGIEHQPKYWVLGAWELDSGQQKILKTEFREEFYVHIGLLKIRCFRSPEKETRVLELVGGDHRFMQGQTTFDRANQNVRVIDFIRGPSLFQYVYNIDKNHREYFSQDLPWILRKLVPCLEGIEMLHLEGTCHGDIRNDHIIIDSDSGCFRWIDFDLNQNVSDFDVWSIGNIFNYVVGKGITTFSSVLKGNEFDQAVKESLVQEDGSAFYEYRIMNLRKLYPYLPPRLGRLLEHFTIRPKVFYTNMSQILEDYLEMLDEEFPSA